MLCWAIAGIMLLAIFFILNCVLCLAAAQRHSLPIAIEVFGTCMRHLSGLALLEWQLIGSAELICLAYAGVWVQA